MAYCPKCGEPRAFYHDYEKDTDYCSVCGNTFTSQEVREYGLMLQKKQGKYRDIEPYEWQKFEEGWRPER